jgi:hypothetical protein
MMPARAGLYVVSGIVVAGLLAGSAIRGHPPQSISEWLAPIGPAVTLAVACLVLFDRWAWRQPGIRRLHHRPLLHGTWHGELATSWIDRNTGRRKAPDPDVFLVIRQKFWSISARLLTNESTSNSLFAELTAGKDGVCQLLYVYLNSPQAAVEHRSRLHYGAVVLNAPRNRHDGLEGRYFTDRKTTGDMRFGVHYRQLVESHSGGKALERTNASGEEGGR